MKIQASVILCKCKHDELFGIRIEKRNDGIWYMTWAFKIDSKRAKKEKFDSTTINLANGVLADPNYPGCPYCGAKGFIVCGDCGKVFCNDQKSHTVTCNWCGVTGDIGGDFTGPLTGGDKV
jgi:DNA-directed RNA polymerase subunit RPC12/RpoP